MGLTRLEHAGSHLWRRVQPLTKRFLPPKHPGAAMALGALWGLLPCGLIYSTLSWAATRGSALEGAVLMSSFGLGTLPIMLLTALGGQGAMRLLRQPLLRKTGGALLIAFGVATLLTPWQHSGHGATSTSGEHDPHAHHQMESGPKDHAQ
jgi:sulfite exporter TauE/SafE